MTEEIFDKAQSLHQAIGSGQWTIKQLEAAREGQYLYLTPGGGRPSLATIEGEEMQKVLDIVIAERRRRIAEAQKTFDEL